MKDSVRQDFFSVSASANKVAAIILLSVGWLFILYEYAVRVSESVIIQSLMAKFHISPSGIGLLSSAYYIPYILMQIPAGILIDRFGLIKSWFFAILSVAIGCYIFANSGTIHLAFIGRIFMGIGSSFAWVGIVNLVYDLFNKKHHATFIGISMVLCMFGALIGQEPWLMLTHYLVNWQRPYIIAMVIGVILSIIVLVIKNNNLKFTKHLEQESIVDIIKSMKLFFGSKEFWILAIYTTVISLPQNAFTALWAVEFFKHRYGYTSDIAAIISSCVWIGGALGAPLIGLLSSRVQNQKRLLIIFNFITILVTITLIFIKINSFVFVSGLLVAMGFVTNASVIAYAAAAQIGEKDRISSTVVSAINMLNMGGASLVQVLMGYILTFNNPISDKLSSFQISLTIMPLTLLISLLMLRFLSDKFYQE